MEDIICKNCGSVNDYTTEHSGPHLKAVCSCGAFIKFLPQEQPKIWFGKYVRTPIKDIIDLSYLNWLVDNRIVKSSRINKAIESRIVELRRDGTREFQTI